MTLITTSNLVEEFYKEHESKNRNFLLFDLANANENANTKVLEHLLKYGKGQFLNSFLNRIGLPKPSGNVSITNQKKAIGNKDAGFIDLYIQYDDVYIIIENKIYGAGDTEKQLARYIATVNGVTPGGFDAWLANPSVDKQTHVVYLTADGTKEPSEDSLPTNLKNLITYYAVNYSDDILPWIEEEVLPNIPYSEDGMMIAGVRQYIAFLKQLLSAESSDVVDAFVAGLTGNDVEKYRKLLEAMDEKKSVPENVLKSLCKQLGTCAEAIFSKDVGGDWVLHFTPSFIILYKKTWAALDSRKYSIPSLHIYAGSTQAFLKKGYFSSLRIEVVHLNPKQKGNYPKFNSQFSNHDKNIGFELLDHPEKIQCPDPTKKEERKKYYKDLIVAVQPVVDIIETDVVEVILKSGSSVTPDELLKKVVNSKFLSLNGHRKEI